MDRLEADLRFFMRELEGEEDPFRRRIIQQRVVATQRAILALMVQEREELDRQNSNMERALEIIRRREERKWLLQSFELSLCSFELVYVGQCFIILTWSRQRYATIDVWWFIYFIFSPPFFMSGVNTYVLIPLSCPCSVTRQKFYARPEFWIWRSKSISKTSSILY